MSNEVKLDIGPKNGQGQSGIKRKTKSDPALKEYAIYEYENDAKKFDLSEFNYNSEKMSHIVTSTIKDITKIVTYFDTNNTKLLLVVISTETKHHYHTNSTASLNTDKDTRFVEFLTLKDLLKPEELKDLLDNIVKHTKLVYENLKDAIKKKLWRSTDIAFNLEKQPGNNGDKYESEVTNENITIEKAEEISVEYSRVRHRPKTSPFFVRRVKLPKDTEIELGNIIPNDSISAFNVYYETKEYSNPLLILLDIAQQTDLKDINKTPNKYMLSKNGKNGEKTGWDIRRIDGSIQDRDGEITKVLANIEGGKELTYGQVPEALKNKLIDVTKDLTINLTGEFTANVGKYVSGGKTIYFKKTEYEGYTSIRHCYGFLGFTVKQIQFGDKQFIDSGLQANPKDTIKRLEVFYNGKKTKFPILILILYISGQYKWFKRYIGDASWQELNGKEGDLQSGTDPGTIQKLISEYSTPSITLDLSQFGYSYKLSEKDITLTINNGQDMGSSGFLYFSHVIKGGQFRLISARYGNTVLEGITSTDPLSSVTAYYYYTDTTFPLLVEVAKKKGKYIYYTRPVSGGAWVDEEREDKLKGEPLNTKLESLREKYIPKALPVSAGPHSTVVTVWVVSVLILLSLFVGIGWRTFRNWRLQRNI